MSLQKEAVDAKAKQYWESLYKEYGKTWVRDIPRRILTAVAEHTKTAKVEDVVGSITPVATAVAGTKLFMEGIFTPNAGKKLLFCAEFDAEGSVKEFDVATLDVEL